MKQYKFGGTAERLLRISLCTINSGDLLALLRRKERREKKRNRKLSIPCNSVVTIGTPQRRENQRKSIMNSN